MLHKGWCIGPRSGNSRGMILILEALTNIRFVGAYFYARAGSSLSSLGPSPGLSGAYFATVHLRRSL